MPSACCCNHLVALDAMSVAASMAAEISSLPRGRVSRGVVRIRAWLRQPRLDAALAKGTDPWSSAELMLRAERLASWSERRHIAAGLVTLVALAEDRLPPSSYLRVRRRAVIEQRDSLLLLAERLDQPAPVEVAVVAELALLLSDASSPAYAGARDPRGLAEITARCVHSVWEDAESD
jgi:hypothetical protein